MCIGLLYLTAEVQGQAMTPMRGEITSYADEFAVRVAPHNPYRHRIEVAIRVYDEKFRPIRARVSDSRIGLAGGATRRVLVIVPFEGTRNRRVRICAESIPYPKATTRIRAQICGRFMARRVQ
nr:hypothetical protein [Nitratireductor basaltis]